MDASLGEAALDEHEKCLGLGLGVGGHNEAFGVGVADGGLELG